MNVKTKQGTVQYWDGSWGGWRNLDAFGDAVRTSWSVPVARQKAKALSGGDSILMSRTRVLVDGMSAVEYRRGHLVR